MNQLSSMSHLPLILLSILDSLTVILLNNTRLLSSSSCIISQLLYIDSALLQLKQKISSLVNSVTLSFRQILLIKLLRNLRIVDSITS